MKRQPGQLAAGAASAARWGTQLVRRIAAALTHARAAAAALACWPGQVAVRERRRLCRDLHDDLGPTLAGLALGLDGAWALAAGLPDLQALLGRLKAEAQRAVTDVGRIVCGLPPPDLDASGLEGSVREDIRRLHCEVSALAVSLDIPGEGLAELPPAVGAAGYRIVTEALTNVVKHAHAQRCSVRVRLGHAMLVEVRDDGVGLADSWHVGVGIASIRGRVAELGGDLLIEPCLPHGTRIAAHLPVARLQ
jgi:two-component system NarL family sensor kinase